MVCDGAPKIGSVAPAGSGQRPSPPTHRWLRSDVATVGGRIAPCPRRALVHAPRRPVEAVHAMRSALRGRTIDADRMHLACMAIEHASGHEAQSLAPQGLARRAEICER